MENAEVVFMATECANCEHEIHLEVPIERVRAFLEEEKPNPYIDCPECQQKNVLQINEMLQEEKA